VYLLCATFIPDVWVSSTGQQPLGFLLEILFTCIVLDTCYLDQRSTNVQTDTIKNAKYLATLSWLPETASSIPSTKLIQFFSAGTNHISSHPIYTDSRIPLCSANGVHGPQIAEWVIMMDLVHSHSYTKLYDNQKKKLWDQKVGMNVSDRVGKRVGVLGYGSIGRQGTLMTRFMIFPGWISLPMLVEEMSAS
jgi:phosphoglycerate dehydrogenase-like enzyme